MTANDLQDHIIGLTLVEAQTEATKFGITLRFACVDGFLQPIAANVIDNRLTVAIVNGIVTETFGLG